MIYFLVFGEELGIGCESGTTCYELRDEDGDTKIVIA